MTTQAKSLKEKTARGVFWGGISNALQQIMQVVFGIFMARILFPEDFGLVGLLTVFSILAITLQDGGFSIALINRKNVSEEEYSSVFWINIIISSILYFSLFFLSPLIAEYFSEPRLVVLSRVVFTTFLFSSVGLVHNTILTKKIEIKKLTIVNLISLFVSCAIGLIMAILDFSYWAIAIQMVVLSILKTVLLWILSSWRPQFTLNFRFIKSIFSFSLNMLLSSLTTQLSNGMFSVLLGKYTNINQVGYYTQSSKWALIPYGLVCNVIHTVSLPVLAEVKGNTIREHIVFRKLLRFSAFISLPVTLGFGFVVSELIPIFVGEIWNECIPIIQLFCISGALNPIFLVYNNILVSNQYSKYILIYNVTYSILLILLLFFTIKYGIPTMVMSMIILQIMTFCFTLYYTKLKLGLLINNFIKDVFPFLLVTLSVFAIAHLCTYRLDNLWSILVLKITISVSGYILLMNLLNVTIFKESFSFIKEKALSVLKNN